MPTESSPPSAASVQDPEKDGQEQHGGSAEEAEEPAREGDGESPREMAGGSGGIPHGAGTRVSKHGRIEGREDGTASNGDRSEHLVVRRRSDPRRERGARAPTSSHRDLSPPIVSTSPLSLSLFSSPFCVTQAGSRGLT